MLNRESGRVEVGKERTLEDRVHRHIESGAVFLHRDRPPVADNRG